jgi:hypothetical protein
MARSPDAILWTVLLANWDLADTVGVAHFPSFPPTAVLSALLASSVSVFRARAALQLEIIALRHQLGVLQRSVKKPKLNRFDRCLVGLALWSLGRMALGSLHRQTGDRHSLAPQGFPAVLDVESSLRPTRAPTGVVRHP